MSSTSSSNLAFYQRTIFATLFIGYACYAYNRKSVSFAMPKLMEDGLQKSDAGLIASSQNLAYAISKFLGGVLSDKISSRLLFASGLLMSGVVTIGFANCDTLTLYMALWFLNGFAQGAGWPACAKLLRQWFSKEQFGTWWSVLSASGNISGSLSPFFAAYLITNYGWRVSVVTSGAVSIVLGVVALASLVNSPTEIGLKSFAELPASSSKSSGKSEKSESIIKSPFLWLISACYMSVFCSKTSVVDWGQMYLMEDRKHSQFVGSAFTSSVETGGFFGGIMAGWLTDILVRRELETRKKGKAKQTGSARLPVAVLFMAGVAVCLHLLRFNVDYDSSKLFITTIGFTLGACLYGCIAIFGVVATESAPPQSSGTAHAVVALAANVGAIISGFPFSFIAKDYGWSAIFVLLEAVSIATVLIMMIFKNIPAAIGQTKVKTN
ncbi:Glucose-6-phosphate exchanger SLC37A4 [Halotydeus destructor]|nr:Glucose-6-phosphate exchanger SLC37A4 [Halotydeus destructor]